MKTIKLLIAILFATGLTNSRAQDTWIRKADFGGEGNYGAVGFSIGSKGYVGTGSTGTVRKDFWEYDAVNNIWAQKADFGGAARYGASGFSIGGKGYIGTGYNNATSTYFNDFWEYDSVTNNWTKKADVGGQIPRWLCAAFSIGSKGYIGTGVSASGALNDFWEYDPSTDKWTRKADLPGGARSNAVGFSINNKGYIGTGQYFSLYKDFWEYEPATNVWTRKADFSGTARINAVGFSINGFGYLGTGTDRYTDFKDFWEYNPLTDSWNQGANYGGTPQSSAIGFSIDKKGYLGVGNFGTEFWQYTPASGCIAPSNLRVPVITDTTALLKWTSLDDLVSNFKIRYHIVGSSTIIKRHTKDNRYHILLFNLLPNTTYEWQIRSNCLEDTSVWVTGPNFTTTSSAGFSSSIASVNSSKAQGNVSMQIMPNPNKGNFTLQMQLSAKAASATLSLYNSLGVKVWQQDAGILSGSVSKNIALENRLSAGVYVLMIQQGDTRLMQKVVVTK